MLSTLIYLVIAFHATESEQSCDGSCPQLYLSYLKDFDPTEDVSKECRNNECVILQTHLIVESEEWTGFCLRDRVLYAFWECGINKNLQDRKIKFACVVNDVCSQTVYCNPAALDDRCLCDGSWIYCPENNSTTTTDTTAFSVVSTADGGETSTTTETCASSTEDGQGTTEGSTESGPATEPPFRCEKNSCFEGECSFGNHCYFFFEPERFQSRNPNASNEWVDLYESRASELCSDADPTALGVAVESPEENVFVKNMVLHWSKSSLFKKISESAVEDDRRILTSGIKRQKAPGVWQGWNSELNETVLGLETSHAAFPEYIALRENSGIVTWYYQSAVVGEPREEISVLCERVEKGWMTSPDFVGECKESESQRMCLQGQKFCCAADENGTLWSGCSGTWSRKSCYPVNGGTQKHFHNRWWYCDENGRFATEFPYSDACICKKCVSRYQEISFRSCYGTEAMGKCPEDRWGYSKWFCGAHGAFEDLPNFDACCAPGETPCRDVDPFANVWVSCPGITARKRTRCPEGTFFESTEATWLCGENGLFASETPDYSGCDCPGRYCVGTDEHFTRWKACAGETSFRDCPSGYGGTASWRCGPDGEFENPRPDFSDCLLTWVDDVQKELTSRTMFSLCMRGILVGCAVLHSFVSGDDDSSCFDVKIENVYHAAKAPKLVSTGRFLVRSAKSRPLKIPGFPGIVEFCYESTFVSARARCYNNATLPSLSKLGLSAAVVEISFVDENCRAVDCARDDLRENGSVCRKKTPPPRPICSSPLDDDPRCVFRGRRYFFRPIAETKGIAPIRLGETCSKILPIAKPVAVETFQEANFIRNLIADRPSFILTSGIKVNESNQAFRFGWNFEKDGKSIPPRDSQIMVLSTGDRLIYPLNRGAFSGSAFVLCETDDREVKNFLRLRNRPAVDDDRVSFPDPCECEKLCGPVPTEPPIENEPCLFPDLCVDVDSSGIRWTARPGTNASAETTCPDGSPREATWYCDETGRFVGSPVYENCMEPTNNCTTDASREECIPDWTSDVDEMIEAGDDSVTIMNTINDHAENDSRTGFREIIQVTSRCVDLFDRQLSGNGSVAMFDNFTESYSRFLRNILTDASVWSDFVVENRINYTKTILDTTEKVAFSKLNADVLGFVNDSRTFTDSDGLSFFVSYGADLVGSKFSGNDSSWSLEVKEIHGQKDDKFAATGLVLGNAIGALMFPKGNETQKKTINAPIISFSLASRTKDSVFKLKNVTVELNFKHLNKSRHPSSTLVRRRLHHESETPSPVFGSSLCYFYGLSDWDSEGCSVTSWTERETNCRCVHLSTISVLMDVHDYRPEPVVEMISMICSGASIVSLLLTLMVFFGFECIKSERTTIGKHLCFCLLIGHVMLLTVMDKKFFYLSDEACSIVAVVFHYVFTAAFFWMAVEGHHLYRLVVVVFESDVDYKTRYLLVGYGVPVLVVGLTELIAVVSDGQAYGQDELCWLRTPGYVWAFTGPVLAITTFNLFVLIVTMRLAVVAKYVDGKSNLTSVKLWLKGWSSLSTLLGVTWLVGLGYIEYNFFFIYAFVVLNGLQGLFIFLFRCVLNDQVRGALVKQYRTRTSQYEESKTVQVNATKSMSRFGKDKSGSVSTVNERRKSSVSSSVDCDSLEYAKDPEFGGRRKLPCGQILQRKTKKNSEDGSLPTYSECCPRSEETETPKSTFPPSAYADFPKRYPPIEEEPDSLDGSEIDNAKENKY